MNIPVSRQAAKALVEQISRNHECLGEEKFQRTDPETRRDVEEALLTKDEMIGFSVLTYGIECSHDDENALIIQTD